MVDIDKNAKILQPYLFIGVGGSGGKTLQYLHYYLSERIKRKGWNGNFPKAWQFIWFDVPTQMEKLTQDTGIPSLPMENYYSFTNQQIHQLYQIEDAFVQSNDEKNLIMGWAPNTTQGGFDIKDGAGQFRAVGRMIVLNQLKKIKNKIEQSISIMKDPSTAEELLKLTSLIYNTSESSLQGQKISQPIPVLVSSLAGGCGAGSFLDISDILKTIGSGEALKASYAFLYTPDVFRSVDAGGLEPNALAAVSELLSSMYTTFEETPHYEYFKKELNSEVRSKFRGPDYPILVGRKNDSIDFQHRENVYKITARSLMGITLDVDVQQDLSNFVGSNLKKGNIKNKDITGLYLDDVDFKPKVLSIGYSSVSLGRDYFEQYVLERFTSKVLDILSSKHITKEVDDGIKTEEQSINEIAGKYFEEFIVKCELNEKDEESVEHDQIINQLLPKENRKSLSKEVVERIVNEANLNISSKDVNAAEWVNRYMQTIPKNLKEFEKKVKDSLILNTQEFSANIEEKLLNVICAFLGEVGGSVTNKLIEMLIKELKNIETELNHQKITKKEQYNQWSSRLQRTFAGQTGKFNSSDPIFDELKINLAIKFNNFTEFITRDVAETIVHDIRLNLLDNISFQIKELTNNASKHGRAEFGADSWASEKNNPKRLHGAANEFFLEDPNEFPEIYQKYIIRTAISLDDRLSDDLEFDVAEVICIKNYLNQFTDNLKNLIYPTVEWVPINVSYRKTLNSMQAKGIYESFSTPEKLLDRTRTWLDQENNSFRKYLNEPLTEYVIADQQNTNVKNQRANNLANKVSSSLKVAKPLIDISEPAKFLVHGDNFNYEMTHSYTRVPIAGENTKSLQDSLLKIYKSEMPDIYNQATNKDTLFFQDPKSTVDIIEYFSLFSQPVQPFIFESLFRPIVDEWNENNTSKGDIAGFWQDRRTRSLTEFLPVPQKTIFGLVRGYFVSNLTGDRLSQLEDLGYKVTIENLHFPYPLIVPTSDGHNLIGALLESLPLAQSLASMKINTEVLDAYVKLLDYGKSYDGSIDYKSVENYEFPNDIKKKLQKKENLVETLGDKLNSFKDYFEKVEEKQNTLLQRKETQTYDLRGFIILALQSIMHACQNIEDSSKNTKDFE